MEHTAFSKLRFPGGGPVVLLHGWPQSWYEWRHVMPALAKNYTVVAPDIRGFGDSSKPLTGYDGKMALLGFRIYGLLLSWRIVTCRELSTTAFSSRFILTIGINKSFQLI
jgi:pimeloyl-ACP methyl ester carboxylesterase